MFKGVHGIQAIKEWITLFLIARRLPVSERCDDQASRVTEVLVSIQELCVHSTDVQVISCPVVPADKSVVKLSE